MSAEPSYACDAEFFEAVYAAGRRRFDLGGAGTRAATPSPDSISAPRSNGSTSGPANFPARSPARAAMPTHYGCSSSAFPSNMASSAMWSATSGPKAAFLNRVVETGRGLPITLSILYMAVADRVGIDLRGVSAPRHFLTRFESVDGSLFVDPFARGRIISQRECVRWLCEISGLKKADVRVSLKPVGSRTIVIRMLNNLKALYIRQESWPAAWMVQHRLAALLPCSYQERHNLALISIRKPPGPCNRSVAVVPPHVPDRRKALPGAASPGSQLAALPLELIWSASRTGT